MFRTPWLRMALLALMTFAIQPASAAREMAMEHGFLTFMPEVAVKRDLREGRLIKLQVSDLPVWEWEVMMAWRSGKRIYSVASCAS